MTGFELRISGFGSKRSANLATTTVRDRTFVNPTNAVRIEFLNCEMLFSNGERMNFKQSRDNAKMNQLLNNSLYLPSDFCLRFEIAFLTHLIKQFFNVGKNQ